MKFSEALKNEAYRWVGTRIRDYLLMTVVDENVVEISIDPQLIRMLKGHLYKWVQEVGDD